MSKAEKAVENNPKDNDESARKQSFREVDDAVVTLLKTRIEFFRLLSHMEAVLQGKAQELESLETYVKTEPRVGGGGKNNNNNKRKRDDGGDEEEAPPTKKASS